MTLLGEQKSTISAEYNFKEAYEQEIGLKMLEMANLKTQIFKIFWGGGGGDAPRLPGKLASMALVLPHPFENPRFARAGAF